MLRAIIISMVFGITIMLGVAFGVGMLVGAWCHP
jgi:hypothetical protein